MHTNHSNAIGLKLIYLFIKNLITLLKLKFESTEAAREKLTLGCARRV